MWHVILSEYQKSKCLYYIGRDGLKNKITTMEPIMRKMLLVLTFVAVLVMPATGSIDDGPKANVSVIVTAPEFAFGTFEVTIDVKDVTNLDSGQFDLSFDPDVVSVVDVNSGSIDGTEMPVDMWRLIEDGIVRVLFNIDDKENQGLSGSGYLAKIIFEAVGAQGDISILNISDGLLVEPGNWQDTSKPDEWYLENCALDILADWFNDTVTIGSTVQASPIPRSTPRQVSDAVSDRSLDLTQEPTTASVVQDVSIVTDSARACEKDEPDGLELLTTQNCIFLYTMVGLFAFIYAFTLLR